MIYEPLKLPHRIYDQLAKQNRFLKPGEISGVFDLISPYDGLIPFQFRVPIEDANLATVTSFKVMKLDGTMAYDLSAYLWMLEVVRAANGYDYIMYKGGIMTGLSMAGGMAYYVEIEVNDSTYYGETFVVDNCLSIAATEPKYLVIEWDGGCGDLGPIIYSTGFKNKVWLANIDIENESLTVEEEGVEDAEGIFVPEKQILVENLTVLAVVPFYMMEALVLMAMHKNVVLKTPGSVYAGQITNIRPTVTEVSEILWQVSISFRQKSIYRNDACCNTVRLLTDDPGCTPATIAVTVLPNGTVNDVYDETVTIAGSAPFEIVGKSLPGWLMAEITPSGLRLTGIPPAAGAYTVTVEIMNCFYSVLEYTATVTVI